MASSSWGAAAANVASGLWDVVREGVTRFGRLPTRVSIGFVALLLTLFLLVNANVVFGSAASGFQFAFVVYLLMGSVFMAAFKEQDPLAHVSVAEFLGTFAITFFVAGMVLLALASATGLQPPAIPHGTSSLVMLAVEVFVIAFNEEITFRVLIPHQLEDALGSAAAAQFVSAILFALFHLAVYQGSLQGMLIAFLAGLVFGAVKENLPNGTTVAIGMHATFNALALGLLSSVPGVTH